MHMISRYMLSGTLLVPKPIAAGGKSPISFTKLGVRDTPDSSTMPLTTKVVLA